MTGRDLVSATLRLIGAIAPGESPSNAEASDGISTINRMLDSWSNDGLLLYTVTQESSFPLVPGAATYSLGTLGDITTRPMRVVGVLIRDSANRETALAPLSPEEYIAISDKTLQGTPTHYYDPGGYPRRNLVLHPAPTTTDQLQIYTERPLTALTLNDSVSLPPGYEEALIYNAAIRLAPEYGRSVSQEIAMVASESKANLKRQNYRPRTLSTADAPGGSNRFNIITGDYE